LATGLVAGGLADTGRGAALCFVAAPAGDADKAATRISAAPALRHDRAELRRSEDFNTANNPKYPDIS